MSSITFSPGTVIPSTWLNDVNTITYITIPAIQVTLTGLAAKGVNNDITSLTALSSVPTVVTTAITTAVNAATSQATETSRGTMELATQAEADAGTDDLAAMTAKKTQAAKIKFGTYTVTTSGTFFDFGSIPSTAKRVTLYLSGVKVSATSIPQVQIGAGSIQTSGYGGTTSQIAAGGGTGAVSISSGFPLVTSGGANNTISGSVIFTNMGSNVWEISYFGGGTDSTPSICGRVGGGSVGLSGSLDRLRLTTVNGTDTFTAGAINVSWE